MIKLEIPGEDTPEDSGGDDELRLFELLEEYKSIQAMRIDCMLEISKLKRSLEQTLTNAEIEEVKQKMEKIMETVGTLKTDMDRLAEEIKKIEDRADE